MREDGRRDDEMRAVAIKRNFMPYAEGSALIEIGGTKVICTASIEDRVPHFLRDKNQGWITAEYSLLPRSTHTRTQRESAQGRVGGRTHEIQRLIGRALRSVVDLKALGERTIWLDCDVLQADGGTRTAAITGAFVSLSDAVAYALEAGLITENPIKEHLAAISVGVVEGRAVLDLCYSEDFAADVDMNVVMTGSGGIVEVQGTAEGSPFERSVLQELMDLASRGIEDLVALQRAELNRVC